MVSVKPASARAGGNRAMAAANAGLVASAPSADGSYPARAGPSAGRWYRPPPGGDRTDARGRLVPGQPSGTVASTAIRSPCRRSWAGSSASRAPPSPRPSSAGRLEVAGFDERAARNLLACLDDQATATAAVPDDRTIVVEQFGDEMG